MLLNKKHASRRVALGKSGVVIDKSMMNIQERTDSEESGSETIGDRAFNDETDLKNEDFIYVY